MAGIGDEALRNITYIKESVTGDESSLEQSEFSYKQVEEEDADAPVVFQCGSCRLSVGDSLSWVGSEDDQNQILLKRVTDNVVIGSTPFISRNQRELGCLIVNLSCVGCSSPLGRVYTSTPKNLDYKRSLFCLSVENVDCYVLGSAKQNLLEDRHDQPVTVEYRANVELQIAKMKELTVSMAQRLFEIEAKLPDNEKK